MSILFFILGVVAYAIGELAQQGKLSPANDYGFWGRRSDVRKYKGAPATRTLAPKTWYYRTFEIAHPEKFPGSATIFVVFTDGYHLMQAGVKVFFAVSVVTYRHFHELWSIAWDGAAYWLLFGVVFTIVYKYLGK